LKNDEIISDSDHINDPKQKHSLGPGPMWHLRTLWY